MEKNDKPHVAFIDDMLASLDDACLASLDFDAIREWLADQREILEDSLVVHRQLQTLRKDYETQITGMARAIAAVDRKRDRSEQTLELVESLPSMPVEQLVTCYHRTSARMRDMFPASFGKLIRSVGSTTKPEDINDFK